MLKWGEKKFPLQPGKVYMVGRKIADIVLDDSVDIKHATIEMVDGAGVLIDLYSDSGTFVDGCKLDAMVRTTIERDSTVHFGKAVTKFLLYNEHEKTFDDDSKNLSDIVFLTPKEISCKPMPSSGFSQKFLNKNDTENDQSKICDSFFIPETQYAYRKSVSLVEDISIEDSVSSFDKELPIMQEGEDFSIPGTQQPIPQSNVVESTETVESDDDGSLAHSQFRICTQEFNGFNESSDLGEEFDNLMDASQLITYIRHQSVMPSATTSANDETRKKPEEDISTSLHKSARISKDSTLNVTDEQNNELFDGNYTPDLYDLPESVQQNAQISTSILADCLPADRSLTAVAKVKSVIGPPLFDDENEGVMPSQKFVVKTFNPVPAVLDPKNDKNFNINDNTLFVEINPEIQATQMLTDRKFSPISKNQNENWLKPETETNEMGSTHTIPTQVNDELLSTNNTNSPATKSSYRLVDSYSSVTGVDKTLLEGQHNTLIAADQMKALETNDSGTHKENAKESGIKNKSILSLQQYSEKKKTNEELSDNSVETIVGLAGLRPRRNVRLNHKKETEKYGPAIVDTSVPQKRKTRLNSQKNTEEKFCPVDKSSSITQIQNNSETDVLSAPRKRSTRLKSKLQSPDVDTLSVTPNKKNYVNTKKDSQEQPDAEAIEAVSTLHTTKRSDPYVKCTKQIPSSQSVNVHSVPLKRKSPYNCNKKPIEKALLENATTADSSLRRLTSSNNILEIIGPLDSEAPSVSLPQKRTTRSKSTIENERNASEVLDTSVNAERNTSLNKTKIDAGKRKAKIETAVKDQKRSRKVTLGLKKYTEEEDDVTCISQPSIATKQLKISTTMVDPKMFKQLSLPANDIWIAVKNPVESDILVMETSNRTYKFLVAMAKGIPIVTTQYLKELSKARILPKPEHFFADANFETLYAFSLRKSYELAGTRKLFAGYDFLLTSNILPPPKEIKDIIECAGGTVHQTTPQYQRNQNLYLVSTSKDKRQWHSYRRANKDIVIVDTEAIMLSIMRQVVEPLTDHRID